MSIASDHPQVLTLLRLQSRGSWLLLPGFDMDRHAGAETRPIIEELAHASISGELMTLYDAHAGALLSYTTRLSKDTGIAQDAVQEAFLRYYIARMQGDGRELSRAWLFRVAHNYVIDRMRSSEWRLSASADGLEATDQRQHPEAEVRRHELEVQMEEALAPRELECIRLRAEGLSYAEIAQVMSIESGTVGALVFRAAQKLRKLV